MYVYVGETQGIVDHINDNEIDDNHANFLRDWFMRGGDHDPFVFEESDLLLPVNDNRETSQIRVGQGYHFHNIISGQEVEGLADLAMFHIDAHPPTSMTDIILHFPEWLAQTLGINSEEGDVG